MKWACSIHSHSQREDWRWRQERLDRSVTGSQRGTPSTVTACPTLGISFKGLGGSAPGPLLWDGIGGSAPRVLLWDGLVAPPLERCYGLGGPAPQALLCATQISLGQSCFSALPVAAPVAYVIASGQLHCTPATSLAAIQYDDTSLATTLGLPC